MTDAGLEAVYSHEANRQALFVVLLDVVKMFKDNIILNRPNYIKEDPGKLPEVDEALSRIENIINECEELLEEDKKIQIFMKNFMEKENAPRR